MFMSKLSSVRKRVFGFTLIELLIVVLIIAILAAIAIPNFLEFQARAKVGRIVSDLRALSIPLEAYQVDNDSYPHLELYRTLGNAATSTCCTGFGCPFPNINRGGIYAAVQLTSPVAYISSVAFIDPFQPPEEIDCIGNRASLTTQTPVGYNYINYEMYLVENPNPEERSSIKWILFSFGPDVVRGPTPDPTNPDSNPLGGGGVISDYARLDPSLHQFFAANQYDPTNGTISQGDIMRFQGR